MTLRPGIRVRVREAECCSVPQPAGAHCTVISIEDKGTEMPDIVLIKDDAGNIWAHRAQCLEELAPFAIGDKVLPAPGCACTAGTLDPSDVLTVHNVPNDKWVECVIDGESLSNHYHKTTCLVAYDAAQAPTQSQDELADKWIPAEYMEALTSGVSELVDSNVMTTGEARALVSHIEPFASFMEDITDE